MNLLPIAAPPVGDEGFVTEYNKRWDPGVLGGHGSSGESRVLQGPPREGGGGRSSRLACGALRLSAPHSHAPSEWGTGQKVRHAALQVHQPQPEVCERHHRSDPLRRVGRWAQWMAARFDGAGARAVFQTRLLCLKHFQMEVGFSMQNSFRCSCRSRGCRCALLR